MEITPQNALDVSWWRRFAPLRCMEAGNEEDQSADKDPAQNIRAELARSDFARLRGSDITRSLATKLASAMERLSSFGLPPLFILCFDEAWQLMTIFAKRMETWARMNYDCYAWRVEPGENGWAPHRDRTNCPRFKDGASKYTTCWIALSDVTEDSACLNFEGRGPQPVAAGDALVWGGGLLHWSGVHLGTGPTRCALALAVSAPDLDAENDRIELFETWNHQSGGSPAYPSFESRIKLICVQLEFYSDVQPIHDPRARTLLDGLALSNVWDCRAQV